MANGVLNIQKTSGGITSVTVVDGTGNTSLVLPESGSVATTAAATETTTGLVELATTAEAQAGTDDLRVVTPLKLKNSVLGLGQTWQDVTGSRVSGTTYTNSTGKPILVIVQAYNAGSNNVDATLTVAGVAVSRAYLNSSSVAPRQYVTAIVPNGATYSASISIGTLEKWSELR